MTTRKLWQRKNDPVTPSDNHHPQKAAAGRHFRLFLLILSAVHTSVLVLILRYTRSRPVVPDIMNFLLVMESGKVLLNSLLEAWTAPEGLVSSIRYHIVDRPMDAIKLLLPAFLYVVQNYLTLYSVGNLTAPVYQALLQGRLLTTAGVSILLLSRNYSLQQWACLLILIVGVTIVIWDTESNHHAATQNSIQGLVALCVSCLTSSLASVSFEYLVKQQQRKPTLMVQNTSKEDATTTIRNPSLWMRSLQLALFSVLLIFLQRKIDSKSSFQKEPRPFFYGFTPMVWLLISLGVSGGSLVATVIKYTDNVLKEQATAVSVVLASGFSTIFFHTILSAYYWLGTALILAAVYVFSNPVTYTGRTSCSCCGDVAAAPKRQELIPLTEETKDDV